MKTDSMHRGFWLRYDRNEKLRYAMLSAERNKKPDVSVACCFEESRIYACIQSAFCFSETQFDEVASKS